METTQLAYIVERAINIQLNKQTIVVDLNMQNLHVSKHSEYLAFPVIVF